MIPQTSGVPLMIGGRATGYGDQYFNGLIDEVSIYSRALSAEEINAHYQKTGVSETELVAHYTFDEGSGVVLKDSSGNKNNGKIYEARYTKVNKGYALEFDGIDDYVDCGSDASLDLGSEGTILLWYRYSEETKTVLDKAAEIGVKTLIFHETWTNIQGYPATIYEDELRSLVKACHERDIQVLLYFGPWLSELAPEWNYLRDDWIDLPGWYRRTMGYPTHYPLQTFQSVCPRSTWADFITAGLAKLMDEFEIDGIYTDGLGVHIFGCRNPAHGCGYIRPDGSVGWTHPLFANRDLLRRLYAIITTKNPEGQLNMHQSSYLTPAMAYATSYWDGEHIRNPHKKHPLDILPLDMFQAEFAGHPLGVPAEFLNAMGADMFGVTLLHDVPGFRPNPTILFVDKRARHLVALWALWDQFGRKEAEWLPYWKNAQYVSASPAGIYVSLYKHPKNGVLAVVSNLGRNPQKAKVKLNMKKLGLAGRRLMVKDALAGQPLAIDSETLAVDLPVMGWKIIWVK